MCWRRCGSTRNREGVGAITVEVSKSHASKRVSVGEKVRHALTEVMQRGEINDPMLEKALVSVTEVRSDKATDFQTQIKLTVSDERGGRSVAVDAVKPPQAGAKAAESVPAAALWPTDGRAKGRD